MPVILRVCVAVEFDPPVSPLSSRPPSFGNDGQAPATSHAPAPAGAETGLPPPSSTSQLREDASTGHHSTFGRLFKKSTAPASPTAAGTQKPSHLTSTACEPCPATSAPPPPPQSSFEVLAAGTSATPAPPSSSEQQQQHQLASAPPDADTPPTNTAAPPPAKDAQRRRSLAWLSVQVTPATTVKAVVQQVQDAVQRRMRANICTEESGSSPSATARDTQTTPPAPSSAGALGCSAALESPKNTAASRSTAPAKEELCLCLADKHGLYRWLGGMRHFPKSAVLQAPFITDVCLRSHTDFEEQRREQRREARAHRAAQRGASRRSLSSSASSAAGSASSAGNTLSLLSVLDGAAGDAQDGGGPAPGPGKRGGGGTRRGRKDTGGETAAPTKPFATTAAAAASADQPKFAFLHGVVLPASVLRHHNAHLAAPSKHHPHGGRTPRQYAEVRVPPELKADPLEPSSEIHVAPAALPASVHAMPVEAPSSASLPVRNTSAASASHCLPSSEGPTTADGAAATASPTTPPPAMPLLVSVPAPRPAADFSRSSSTCSGSSASTQPSRTLHVDDDAHAERHHHHHDHHSDGSSSAAAAPSPRLPTGRGVSVGSRTNSSRVAVAPSAPAAVPDVPIVTEEGPASVAALLANGLSDRQACAVLAGEEPEARRALALAQAEYAAALAEYKAVAPPAPGDVDVASSSSSPSAAQDAEWSALVQRKLELRRELETYRQAERQCERLTTLAECLERELQDHTERRALLAGLHHDVGDAVAPVGGT